MDEAASARISRVGTCPYVNRNDAQCATRFQLGRLDQAFDVCFGAFHACPMYHRINRTDLQRQGLIEVTVSVPDHAIPLPLRRTGS